MMYQGVNVEGLEAYGQLAYKPVETFETGIHKTIQWYLDNEDWWRGVMDGSYKEWLDKNYSDKKTRPHSRVLK